MRVEATRLSGVLLLTPEIHRDQRGLFSETFNVRTLAANGVSAEFVQDNQSLSSERGVVRGMHFQVPPRAQGKLIRVLRGSILDVAVDLRQGSHTYGQHVSHVLSAENWRQAWVPVGFAHGFCTLEPDTEIIFKVTDYFAPECARGLAWDDPALAIDWPVDRAAAILSEKDRQHPPLAELPAYFEFIGP